MYSVVALDIKEALAVRVSDKMLLNMLRYFFAMESRFHPMTTLSTADHHSCRI